MLSIYKLFVISLYSYNDNKKLFYSIWHLITVIASIKLRLLHILSTREQSNAASSN